MTQVSSSHFANCFARPHTTTAAPMMATTATTTATAAAAAASSILMAREGRACGPRSPTVSNASVLMPSTAASTSATASATWPQCTAVSSSSALSYSTALLSSQQQQQQQPQSPWQVLMSTVRKAMAIEGKQWIALGVCIIVVEIIVFVGMFSSMPVIDEQTEQSTLAVLRVLRRGVEWATPEAWAQHLALNLMNTSELLLLFRLRVMLVAHASRPHALAQTLRTLTTGYYAAHGVPVDLHVFVRTDAPCTGGNKQDDGDKQHDDATRREQQLLAETMRVLDDVAWTRGRYEVHMDSVFGGGGGCDVCRSGSTTATPPSTTTSFSSSSSSSSSCAARVLRSMWHPTSLWEISLLLDDHVRLSPLWYEQLRQLLSLYVVNQGVYRFVLSHNAFARTQHEDGTPRQWHMEDANASAVTDTLLGIALHDTFPVLQSSGGTTTTTTTTKRKSNTNNKDVGNAHANAQADAADGRAASTAAAAVQYDMLERASDGTPYLAQRVGAYGTLFLPYSWRVMTTWLQDEQQEQATAADAAAQAGKQPDNTATAGGVAAAAADCAAATTGTSATALPCWRGMQRYIEARGMNVLYPSSPYNAALAKLDADASMYKTSQAFLRAQTQLLQLSDTTLATRREAAGDAAAARQDGGGNRDALDRYDASGVLLLRK